MFRVKNVHSDVFTQKLEVLLVFFSWLCLNLQLYLQSKSYFMLLNYYIFLIRAELEKHGYKVDQPESMKT